MEIYNSIDEISKSTNAGRFITIGNFDGCHLGHQSLVRSTKGLADQSSTVVMTFEPHPRDFLNGTDQIQRLFSPSQKARLLRELGVDELLVTTFDESFRQITHSEFYHHLAAKMKMKGLVIGQDFRFGHKRLGDVTYLRNEMKRDGLTLLLLPLLQKEGKSISSTRIRNSLMLGLVEECADMLGRPFVIEGVVGHGKKLGRQIGFPTANLEGVCQILPGNGVYAGYAVVVDPGMELPSLFSMINALPAVVNVGIKPTVAGKGGQPPSCEVHILNQEIGEDSLYDKSISFFFCHRLRGERTFASLQDLKMQISSDIQHAKSLLSRK